MEKYFEVTSESALWDEYNKYEEAFYINRKKAEEFCVSHNIGDNFGYLESMLFLKYPSNEDKEKFKGQLCSKSSEDGYVAFKKNSKIGKDWKNKGFKVLYRPFVGSYFQDCLGRTSSRIFKIGDKVYCSFKNEYDTMETPKGFNEMKASEFFKIIEDNEYEFCD